MKKALPLLIVLLVSVFFGLREGLSPSEVPGDFLRYHRAGRIVWTGLEDKLYDMRYTRGQHVYAAERAADAAERGDDADEFVEREWKYAPATAVMLAPIGSLHPKTGIALWGAWNGFLIAICLVACWHWASQRGSQANGRKLSGHWMWLAVIALWRIGEDNLHLGQLNPSAIVPATLGLYFLARGRQVAAGALIAFGTVVKFMPGGLALWLAWKRQWKALGVWAACVVLLGYGLPAVVFGPTGANDVNQAWIDARAHHYTKAEIADVPGHSIKSFVYRTLGSIPYQSSGLTIDVGVAELPASALANITMALNLLVLCVVLYAGRGRLEPWGDPRGPPVAALMLACLLFVSPEARGPHFLYLALAGVTLTYLLVRTHAKYTDTPAPATLWRWALALAIVGTLLLQSDSKGLFGRTAAKTMTAYCTKGFGALAWMAALGLLLPRRAKPETGAAPEPAASE